MNTIFEMGRASDVVAGVVIPYLIEYDHTSILDAGCYGGRNLNLFLSCPVFENIYAVDLDSEPFRDLQKSHTNPRITFHTVGPQDPYPVKDCSAALLWRVVHLITNKEERHAHIRKVWDSLAIGGVLCLAVRSGEGITLSSFTPDPHGLGVVGRRNENDPVDRLYYYDRNMFVRDMEEALGIDADIIPELVGTADEVQIDNGVTLTAPLFYAGFRKNG